MPKIKLGRRDEQEVVFVTQDPGFGGAAQISHI